ncbi:hypothetical protein MT418_000595 [Batrachochytrium dendrobatidis]
MATTATHSNTFKSDYLIINRRREEESRNQSRETKQYYAQAELKSQFEEKSSQSIHRKQVLRKFNELKIFERSKLEERQERLRQLFADDEETYRSYLLSKQETRESRVDTMRKRVSELREQRERERKSVVEEKLMQRWRKECDDLRTIESKVLEKKVSDARAIQIQEQIERKALERKEELYYQDLWEQDRQKKICREESDRAHLQAINESTTQILEQQLRALKSQAQKEVELKREEARLMREEHETQLMEDERKHQRKLQEQRLIRQDLDDFNKKRLQQRQKDVQEALEMDMRILSEFLKLEKIEKENKQRRRDELRHEMQLYREHLLDQKEVERLREEDIERWYIGEQERLWKARTEKWRKEQSTRDKLMKEVMDGRHEQIKYALERNRQNQEQIRSEKLEIAKQIEEAKACEAARHDKVVKSKRDYSNTLRDQIEIAERHRVEMRHRNQQENELSKVADEKYRMLLQQELARALQS